MPVYASNMQKDILIYVAVYTESCYQEISTIGEIGEIGIAFEEKNGQKDALVWKKHPRIINKCING